MGVADCKTFRIGKVTKSRKKFRIFEHIQIFYWLQIKPISSLAKLLFFAAYLFLN